MAGIPRMHAAILAGGSGQRFWPLSRELSPKQLLSMFGTESLIVQAIRRVLPLTETGAPGVLIVTNERLQDELRNHLAAQHDDRLTHLTYLLEPRPRNTAAAVALACAVLADSDPEALVIVLPSDHVLDEGKTWDEAIRSAAKLAEFGHLVTIGIQPSRPETGYGYIRAGETLEDFVFGDAVPRIATEFVEKPEADRARQFLDSGEYLWNAGIFVMKVSKALEEFDTAGEDAARIAEIARWFAEQDEAGRASDEARRLFEELPSVSFDKAVMEHSSAVAVVPAPLRWDDVGSLQALSSVAKPDENGNVRVGRGVDVDSHDVVVYSADRLVATLGLKDIIVADTADATLVLDRERAQDVRLVVEALARTGAEELLQPRTSLRPWGSWTTLLKGQNYQIKIIEIHAGAKLSLQKHNHRSEHWVVVAGTARVSRDGETFEVHPNESAFIPIGTVHRIENCGKVPLKVIEVQVGEYVGEDDIIRIEDDWSRGEGL